MGSATVSSPSFITSTALSTAMVRNGRSRRTSDTPAFSFGRCTCSLASRRYTSAPVTNAAPPTSSSTLYAVRVLSCRATPPSTVPSEMPMFVTERRYARAFTRWSFATACATSAPRAASAPASAPTTSAAASTKLGKPPTSVYPQTSSPCNATNAIAVFRAPSRSAACPAGTLMSIPNAAASVSPSPTRAGGMPTERMKYSTLTETRMPLPNVRARLLAASTRTGPRGGTRCSSSFTRGPPHRRPARGGPPCRCC